MTVERGPTVYRFWPWVSGWGGSERSSGESRDRWGRRRLAAAGRSAPDDDQVSASKGDPLPFGQVAPAKDVLPVGVDGDLDRLG